MAIWSVAAGGVVHYVQCGVQWQIAFTQSVPMLMVAHETAFKYVFYKLQMTLSFQSEDVLHLLQPFNKSTALQPANTGALCLLQLESFLDARSFQLPLYRPV